MCAGGRQVNMAAGNVMEVGATKWQLVQYHFHTPSEHALDRRHAPMEAHLVHQDLATGSPPSSPPPPRPVLPRPAPPGNSMPRHPRAPQRSEAKRSEALQRNSSPLHAAKAMQHVTLLPSEGTVQLSISW